MNVLTKRHFRPSDTKVIHLCLVRWFRTSCLPSSEVNQQYMICLENGGEMKMCYDLRRKRDDKIRYTQIQATCVGSVLFGSRV